MNLFIGRCASVLALLCCLAFRAEQLHKLPSVEIKALNGKRISATDIVSAGKPGIVIVWDVGCRPGVSLLNVVGREYDSWRKETGVTIAAVSVDEFRNASAIQSLYTSKGWSFDVYLDQTQSFKRAMNVNFCPYVFVLNRNGEIAWQKGGYTAGDERFILEALRKVAKDEKPE